MNKEICHKCKKYPAEYNQTECEFCMGISTKDEYISELEKQITQLTNNWNELEEWLEKQKDKNFVGYIDGKEFYLDACYIEVLDKMKEIKERK